MNTKVINLFGQPSAGKSTTSAGLFFEMKHRGMNVELVDEYAKQMVWSDRQNTLEDQLYITAKQNAKLLRLQGKVSYVVTDSPLLLGLIYKKPNYYGSYWGLVWDIWYSYDNFNVFLNRTKPYNPVGRNQNEIEADEIAKKIKDLLDHYHVPYVCVDGNKEAPLKILAELGIK